MLRIGIIGAGQVGERHAAAFGSLAGAEVVGVADPDPERGERVARRCGAAWAPALETLLETTAMDAVVVCVPHHLLHDTALAAVDRGLHVLLEKPMATTLADADAIVEATDRARVALMVGFVHRFRAEWLAASELVAEGAVGTPVLVVDRFCAPGGTHPPGWVWERSRAGGGVLMYGGIHAVDRLLWLLGDGVVSVAAEAHEAFGDGDVEDGLAALLRFRGGASAVIAQVSPPYGRPGGWTTEVFGTEGALRIQSGAWAELTGRTRSLTITANDEAHFDRQAAEFVAAIDEGRAPSVTGSDGRAALAVATALYEAAELAPARCA